MESLLRDAEATGHSEKTASHFRKAIREAIGSEQFSHFIRTTSREDGHQWPVAMLSAAAARRMELRDKAGVVRLTSDTASQSKHRARWAIEFEGDEWRVLQHLIEEGRWLMMDHVPKHREVWGDPSDKDKWWKAVFKETYNGELMLTTYHRLNDRSLRRQEEKLQQKISKGL